MQGQMRTREDQLHWLPTGGQLAAMLTKRLKPENWRHVLDTGNTKLPVKNEGPRGEIFRPVSMHCSSAAQGKPHMGL